MPELDLQGGGGMMIIVGAAWVLAGWFLSTLAMQAGIGLVSLGVILIGFAPTGDDDGSESEALTTEDLEDDA